MWSYVFCSQLVSSSTAWGCGARRWCRHLGRPPDTEPWSCHWNQWTLMKSKIPVTISMKIYANQAPATSFFMPLLWLMWWTFCEIKWLRVLFLNAHTSLFVCLFVVCLLTVHTFVWIHVNVHVRNWEIEKEIEIEKLRNWEIEKREIGKLFHQHRNKIEWITKLGSFCSFSSLTLPHISKHCTSM